MITVYKKFFLMLGVTVLLCISASVVWGEDYSNLVERPLYSNVYYKKFSDVPFTGKVTGLQKGYLKNGVRHGLWIAYWDNGQLRYKGNYKNGKSHGEHVAYYQNGQLRLKGKYVNGKREGYFQDYDIKGSLDLRTSGTYKNDEKISN